MVNIQDLSSNLLLVGFALISICCLYLLYSNFSKVREINELKYKFEDLKNIFINQQKHNDESYIKIMKLLQESENISDDNSKNLLDIQINKINSSDNYKSTKVININSKSLANNILNANNIINTN